MSYQVIVAEDNGKIRDELVGFLKDNGIQVVGEATTGTETKLFVQKFRPQVLFVDIHMPDEDGFTVAKQLRSQFPELCIVFISGFTEFAPHAFEIEALDYIVKPFTHDRLYQCLKRIDQTLGKNNALPAPILSFRNRNVIDFVDQEQVVFISAENKSTKVYLAGKHAKLMSTLDPLKELERRLDPKLFIRTHRSYIINIKHIQRIEPAGQTYVLHFKNSPHTAYLSRNYLAELYNRLQI